MSLQLSKSRRRRRARMKAKPKASKSHWIRAKINHKNCLVNTDDHGTFADMYAKYGQADYTYFCADMVDERGEFNYRLDSDFYPSHTLSSLATYGHKLAWIMPGLRLNGKKVILVKEAAKHEMIVSIEATAEMRVYLEWLRFQSRRLKVPENQVFVALSKEWKEHVIEVVIPQPVKPVVRKKRETAVE